MLLCCYSLELSNKICIFDKNRIDMEEIWKTIEDYPNYMISSMGRVKSLWFGKEKILKIRNDSDGYVLINFHKNKKQITFKVHRLVAQAFIPNSENKPHIDHINGIRDDNRVENLRWVTEKENNNNPIHRNKISENKKMIFSHLHFASKPILQFSLDGEFIKKWNNAQDVARERGLYSGANIQSCCKGNLKTSGNYKWGYADDYERIPFKVFDLEIYRKKTA